MMIVALVVCGAGLAFGVAVGSSYVRIHICSQASELHERVNMLMLDVLLLFSVVYRWCPRRQDHPHRCRKDAHTRYDRGTYPLSLSFNFRFRDGRIWSY